MSDGMPHWVEDDGTEVWLVAAEGAGRVPDLADRMAAARGLAPRGAVLGANADAADDPRVDQLQSAGFTRVFSMVTMTRSTRRPTVHPLPDLRSRIARKPDATTMHELTQLVWRGRARFTTPDLGRFDAWLARADLTLFLLAEHDGSLVGYVAGEPDGSALRIDDVQVHPDQRRRGIATELVARLLELAGARGLALARLETEGDDPVGARIFYESIGFAIESEALRFRRPV